VNWSPESRRVGFSGYGQGDDRGLWVFEVDSGSVTQIAAGPRALPAWSPDGKRLAFDLREPSKERGIWVADLEPVAPRPAEADK
jgi:Tol biopolymer transport system component